MTRLQTRIVRSFQASTTVDPTSRRRFCWLTIAGLLAPMVGCEGSDGDDTSAGSGTDGDGSTGADSMSSSGTSSPTTAADTGSASTTDDADTSSGSVSGGSSDGETGFACEPTDPDIEGPFYRPEIPIGGNLDIHGDTGEPLVLEGRVLDTGCSPLAGAIVEIWHATPVAPGGAPGDVEATYDDTAAFRYYGQVATDERGRYQFTTLKPGWYLNGAEYRPAHVHVKVWVGGQERLTTQLYFVGDPFNAGDAWFNPELALQPDPDGNAEIDFVVE